MQKDQSSSLFSRSDTMFGVCQGLGEDFGFNPNWLRVGFALMVVFNVGLALAAYAGAAVLVAVSRFAYPTRRKALAPQPVAEAVAADKPAGTASVDANNDADLLLAAAA